MFDYTRATPYPIVTEPTPDARFREEYVRVSRKPHVAKEIRENVDSDLIIARYVQRAAAFFRFA